MVIKSWLALVFVALSSVGGQATPWDDGDHQLAVVMDASRAVETSGEPQPWVGTARLAIATGGGDAVFQIALRDLTGAEVTLSGVGHAQPYPARGALVVEARARVQRTDATGRTMRPASAELIVFPETGDLFVQIDPPGTAGALRFHFDDAEYEVLALRR